VITGFNTDVEHGGVVYHVQTEDKGLDSPLILSLVYLGGAILASKRTPYDDLIALGLDERALASRLERQHKIICAAIHTGRIDDLKRMSLREQEGRLDPPHATEEQGVPPPPLKADPKDVVTRRTTSPSVPIPPPPTAAPPPLTAAPTPPPLTAAPTPVAAAPPPIEAEVRTKRFEPLRPQGIGETFRMNLLEERELRGGEFVTLRVRVSQGSDDHSQAVQGASITVKILGTAFHPLVSSATTDSDGIAIVFASLPVFRTGRAAILIRAEADGKEAELRRIIKQA
jgi:hypothetical protein